MSELSQPTPMAAPPRSRIAHNFMFLGGGQIISVVIGVVLTAVVARTLGPSDYGLWFLIYTIAATTGVVGDWGQGTTVMREIARGRPDRAQFLGSAAVLRTFSTLFAAGIAFAFAFVSGYSTFVVMLAGLAVLAGFPMAFVSLMGAALRGIDRTDMEVLAHLLAKLLGAVVVIVALYLGGGLLALVLAPAVAGMIVLYYTWRMFTGTGLGTARPNVATVRENLVAGAPLVVMAFTISVHGLVEVALLAMLTSPVVVGWLAAARTFVGLLIAPATILAMASFPEISRASHSPTELEKVLSASTRPLLAAGGLVTCGVFALALPAVQLVYGQNHFDPAALALQICAPFFPMFFVNFLMGYAAVAIGKSNDVAVAKLVCVGLAALLSWFLIPYFQASIGNGAVGVMISYCASEVLMTIAYVRMMPRGLIGRETLGLVARTYLAAAVVAYIGIKLAPMVSFWIALAAIPLLFAAVALIAGLLRLSDIETLLGMIRSFLDRLSKSAR